MSNSYLDFEEVILTVTDHWVRAWKRDTELPVCEKRLEELHPSSFPFCGIRYALDLTLSGGTASTFDMPATMEFYCGVGTVAHLIFQKHMRLIPGNGRNKSVMVGDWICPDCGYRNKFRPYHSCKKCKSPSIRGEVARLSGDEIHVQMGSRTTGHTDDVIKIEGKYYVVDYKTSSTHMVQIYRKHGKALPYTHNVRQIESYVALLEKKYGIEISGWILIYAARDNPAQNYAVVGGEITPERRQYLKEGVENADRLFHIARKHIAPAVADGVVVFNGNEKKIDKLTNMLISNKICPNQQHYEDEIMDKYNPCPYAESGICFKPKMMKNYTKGVFLRMGAESDDDGIEELED